MSETFPDVCPRCAGAMEAGFASRATPLSSVALGKLDRVVFKDEDLVKAGWRVLLRTVRKQSISRITLEHAREFPLSFLDGMNEVVITFASGGRWSTGFGRRAEVLGGVVESVKAELSQAPHGDQLRIDLET